MSNPEQFEGGYEVPHDARFAIVAGRFNDLIVERLREAGAICIGKTNTPEFGAGSQTFNEVFGATRNPYDTTNQTPKSIST